MHDLTPLSALGSATGRAETIGAITFCEEPNWAIASVAFRTGAKQPKSLLGAKLPAISEATLDDPITALWFGPDQYLLLAPYETHEDIAPQVKAKLKDAASVTEQSDAWVVVRAKGAALYPLFEHLCPFDMRRMAAGSATRTSMEHISAFVLCVQENEEYLLLSARSSAASFWHVLETAAHTVA